MKESWNLTKLKKKKLNTKLNLTYNNTSKCLHSGYTQEVKLLSWIIHKDCYKHKFLCNYFKYILKSFFLYLLKKDFFAYRFRLYCSKYMKCVFSVKLRFITKKKSVYFEITSWTTREFYYIKIKCKMVWFCISKKCL